MSCPLTLLDQVRQTIRTLQCSYRTEQTYVMWVRRYLDFHDCANPSTLAESDIAAFLSDLAINKNVSRNTQLQAQHAIEFLYNTILNQSLKEIPNIDYALKSEKSPFRTQSLAFQSSYTSAGYANQ